MTAAVSTPDLAARTLQLVDVPSESRREAELYALVRELVPGEALHDDGEVLLGGDPASPVVLAGHLDTVPAQGNLPGRIEDGVVHGLGASDMKAGVAVMVELALGRACRADTCFFTREELPVAESPLPALFATGLLEDARLAVVLEPTDCILHAGCLGNLQARVDVPRRERALRAALDGRERDPRARAPDWRRSCALEPLDVELDGLVYREVVSAVRVEGGIAAERRAGAGVRGAELPLRARPQPRRRRGAAARARPARRARGAPQLALGAAGADEPAPGRGCGVLVPEVAPKQAWTPVAQFAEQGIDAVNYGPGATAYAHKRDEQMPVGNLERATGRSRRSSQIAFRS